VRGVIFFNAFLSACIFYLLLQLFFGSQGIYSLQQNKGYARDLEAHIVALEEIQERLKEDVIALQVSEERLREEAHRIGYYDRNDIVIRREGDQSFADENDFGRYLYSPVDTRGDSRALFRWLALTFGLVALIVLGLFESRAHRESANGEG